jgi:hypothetical protein
MYFLYHVKKGIQMNSYDHFYTHLHSYKNNPIYGQNTEDRNPLFQLSYDLQLQNYNNTGHLTKY